MYAVESNNADMVHFLIEVMMVCGQGGRRGGKGCDSALFDKFGFLFQACELHTELVTLSDKAVKELEQR